MNSLTIAKIYDRLLEPALKSLKQRIAFYAKKYNAFPILDICCGTGKQTCYFSKSGRTAGLDLDLHMISFAAQKYPHIPFILADATQIPLHCNSFKAASISLALHDKSPNERLEIINSAKNLVGENGHIILLDFENPWNSKSKLGYFLVYLVELMAGWEHFQNGRKFLQNGGLKQFISDNDLIEIDRYNSEKSCSAIVVVQQK